MTPSDPNSEPDVLIDGWQEQGGEAEEGDDEASIATEGRMALRAPVFSSLNSHQAAGELDAASA